MLPAEKLKAIYRPSGGVWGGMKVDDDFQAFLLQLCGRDAIQSLTKSNMLQIQRSFEAAKKKATAHGQDMIKVWLPLVLRQNIKYGAHEGKYRLIADKLCLTAETMRGFFDKLLKRITKHLKVILDDPELKDVRYIVMVGGFSESNVLQNAVTRAFPKNEIIIVPQTNSAVVRGAVIYGHDLRIIRWRKLAYTYGVRCMVPFADGYHNRSKLKQTDEGPYCCDIFDKFVSVNDSIEVGKHTVHKQYGVCFKEQKECTIHMFRCDSPDPMYTTDLGCEMIGSLRVKMPDLTGGTERKLNLSVEFGNTEMQVEAVDGNTGVKFKAAFEFLTD